MAIENISTKEPGSSRELVVSYNFGETVADAIEMFGEEAVFAGFKADCKVGVQAFVRGRLKATEEDSEAAKYSDEDIIAAVADWKPGTKSRASADPMAKLQALLGKLSPEQRAALLEQAL
jgi:hypothetical protein